MRALNDEDNEGGKCKDERYAPSVNRWVESSCKRSSWRGGSKAAENGSFFVVIGRVDGMTTIVC